MGVVEKLLGLLFGDGRNVVRETVELFMENSENAGARDAEYRSSALQQFASEFAIERKGRFDRFMDGLNRVPRPLMAFGTIGLCVAAMVDPVWFATRMQGIALVPEPLWWLLGAIVSFYFGARFQYKSQDLQRSIATTMMQAPIVSANIAALNALAAGQSGLPPVYAAHGQDNPALSAWRAAHDE
ncbi:holin family protein [Celeribacter sp.]|uniref:holin family protein n=1 Tax=Celeribacter sp. TaxID=1890673 RepID=UPI003A90597C